MGQITFEILFWLIIGVSFVCFMMDFARAKPDVNKKANFMYDFGMVLVMICITLIVGRFVIMLEDTEYLDSDLKAAIISLCFFLMIFRKVAAMLTQGIVAYLCAISNSFAQRVEPKLIIKNQDPYAEKPVQISLGILRIGHTVIFIISALLAAICSAFPGLANSRINVFLNQVINLFSKAAGTLGERMVFMLWMVLFAVFWIMFFVYIVKLYNNFMNLIDNKLSDIVPIRSLRITIIVMFFIRKVFSYIFIMNNYQLEDFAFWWFIVGACILASIVWYLIKKKTGNARPTII